ncbi:MAG: glycosyltransferase family 29 protein [Pirellulales bacterium]|nr:glycosyltransferase family 29 protein [Pirellulales bacterium]
MRLRVSGFVGNLPYLWKQRAMRVCPWDDFVLDWPMRGRSIAIVGNAGYLRDLSAGSYIDQHDLVVRMNNFQLAGFEHAVGRRLDIWMTNFSPKTICFDNPEIALADHIVSSRPNVFRKSRRRRIVNRMGQHITLGMGKLGRRVVYVPSIATFSEWTSRIGKYPTTGMMAILWALEVLAPLSGPIFITGFSFFEGPSHYFCHTGIDAATLHDPAAEKHLLQRLLAAPVRSGKVTLDAVMSRYLWPNAESNRVA